MSPNNSAFPTTHWSLVRVVQHGGADEARAAMEAICGGYWYPIYAYLRHCGYPPADAEDLTQGVFQRVIGGRALFTANPESGRLRSYLLGVLKRHLRDQKRHEGRLKRGGGEPLVSIDELAAEARFQQEPRDVNTPDKLFDRSWAEDVLNDATEKLRQDFVKGDNEEAFLHLSEFLPLGANSTPYRKVATRMGIKESVVRLQVHRMRQRYRELILEQVGLTVTDPADINEEVNHLMSLMG